MQTVVSVRWVVSKGVDVVCACACMCDASLTIDESDEGAQVGHSLLVDATGVVQLHEHVLLFHLGVVHHHLGTLLQQRLGNVRRCRLACVASVLLEGKPEERNALARDRVEEGGHDVLCKAKFLEQRARRV